MVDKRLFPGIQEDQVASRRSFREAQEALERQRATEEEQAEVAREAQLERQRNN